MIKYIKCACITVFISFLIVRGAFSQVNTPQKVLHVTVGAPATGFDPAVASDVISAQIITSIYETLYTYDYLARPAKLVCNTAQALPQITNGGKTYTITLKKGIYFAPDPVFKGKKRELIADDYIYAIKRLMDPSVRSSWQWLVAGKIQGLDELAKKAKKTGKFSYDEHVKGLQRINRYTFKIHLKKPDYQLTHILAHSPTSAMAREVVERYVDKNGQVMDHPVGTGPFVLSSWVRGHRAILDVNPNFREVKWNFRPQTAEDKIIVSQMQGKKLPQVQRIVIDVIAEEQSRWLAFQKGEIDILGIAGSFAPKALKNGELSEELKAKGVQLSRSVEPSLIHYYFNMQNPVVGGMSKEKIALRRAIAMAHSVDEEIQLLFNGQAKKLSYLIPPSVAGYDENYKSFIEYNPDLANALLDQMGYTIGQDGYRKQPNGAPLAIVMTTRPDSIGTQQLELWKKTFDLLSIKMIEDKRLFPDLIKAERQCQLMMRTAGWIADYPDASNFMQLFYGGHIGQSNHACVAISAFDRLYEQTVMLPDGPKRNRLYHKMARILQVYGAIHVAYTPYRNILIQPNIIGYKKHPFMYHDWFYIDIKNESVK